MKKYLIVIYLFTIISSGYLQAQCDIEVTVPIENTSTDKGFNLGQSFTACQTGVLESIGLIIAGSTGANKTWTDLEMVVYDGEGISGTVLGTFSNLTLSHSSTVIDYKTINVSSANILVTSGQKYTYSFPITPTGAFYALSNVYSGGMSYISNTSYPDNDYLFKISIVDSPTPVELTTFSAIIENNRVFLNWETATEVNNYGFEIERHASIPLNIIGQFIPSEDEGWEKIAFVEGHGNSNSPKFYSFTDKSIEISGKYLYRLKQVDIDGTFEYSDEVEVNLGIPKSFELKQNYPNPFNPTTSISYSILNDNDVTLTIIDVLGEEVAVLEDGYKAAGSYSNTFNAIELTSGIYFYRLQVKNFVATKKMILLR